MSMSDPALDHHGNCNYQCASPGPEIQVRRQAQAMKVISYLLALIAVALCASCSIMSPTPDFSSKLTSEVAREDCFTAALDERMPALLASNRVPGAVVSYIKNGEVAWTKAFGVANIQTGSPMRA